MERQIRYLFRTGRMVGSRVTLSRDTVRDREYRRGPGYPNQHQHRRGNLEQHDLSHDRQAGHHGLDQNEHRGNH